MSTIPVGVHLDLDGTTAAVGTAYVTTSRGVTTTVFDYEPGYLAGDLWSISPDLPVAQQTARTNGLPGAMSDSAPDRWGRNLIERNIRTEDRSAGRTPRTVTEVDFLLGVSDVTRQGALRYTVGDDQTFLADRMDVPKLIDLPILLHASRQVGRDADSSAAIKTLLDAGSGSLGGARPKASVTDGGQLHIAKFPHDGDNWNVIAWEMTALDLAEQCGLRAPKHQLVPLGPDQALLLARFDRDGARRIPYISAMTMLGVPDGSHSDYIDLAEALMDHGSDVKNDLRELWRRIAFSIVINNTDDHMRNHGFLWSRGGWKLSPLFDVNPNLDPGAERVTSILGATSHPETLNALKASIDIFELSAREANDHLMEIRQAASAWKSTAVRHGVVSAEIDAFEAVFTRS